ncbi:MAG: M17 family peptidase N-terminal domain-containing protein [Myxococcota bacterium]
MSAVLDVEIDPGPLERTRADVLVVFYFDSDRPLRGGAGRADWRLCGQLSQLLLAGRLGGARGEAVLVPTAGGLAAPLLIGLGLGSRDRFDAATCEALGRDAVDRGRRLGAKSLALPLPEVRAGGLELAESIEALVSGAVAALADLSTQLRLRLVPPLADVARAQALLSETAPRSVASVVVRVSRAAVPRGVPAPQGAKPFSPIPRQTIK